MMNLQEWEGKRAKINEIFCKLVIIPLKAFLGTIAS